MTLIILRTQIIARNIYKIITFMVSLFNEVFLQSRLQEICCFLECQPTCQFRILFVTVWCHLLWSVLTKPRKTPIQNIITLCTVLLFHEYWSPEKPHFWIFVKYEQHSTKIHKFHLVSMVTIDLPLPPNSLSLLYQWPAKS